MTEIDDACERSSFLGGRFPGASLEGKVLEVAAGISPGLGDTHWSAVVLCNGGVFLRPTLRATFEARTPGGCGGPLSSEAFGLLVTLLTLGGMPPVGMTPVGMMTTKAIDPVASDDTVHLEALRSYALLHPEWESVRRLLG
jgi:hypothetical protein